METLNPHAKKYARIWLEVTGVRVERLQDIEVEDIQSEGYPSGYELKNTTRSYTNDTHSEVDYCDDCLSEWWTELWDSTAPKGYKYEDNPYVFVYDFKRIEK